MMVQMGLPVKGNGSLMFAAGQPCSNCTKICHCSSILASVTNARLSQVVRATNL